MGRLVVLSGPSCVGKGPLLAALRKFQPEAAEGLTRLVLCNSRAPRPGEVDGVDYHFRRREEIEGFRQDAGFVVMDIRGDWQALDLTELERILAAGDALFEGNPFMGHELGQIPVPSGARQLTVFLSPLSREEVLYLRAPERRASLPDLVTELMRRKLLRRITRQKGVLSLKDLEEAERRASSAYGELKLACRFQHVIPNHDGEDSENWTALYYPVGDARKALLMFTELLAGRVPAGVEQWEEGLLA